MMDPMTHTPQTHSDYLAMAIADFDSRQVTMPGSPELKQAMATLAIELDQMTNWQSHQAKGLMLQLATMPSPMGAGEPPAHLAAANL
jgi:hypothetical protein